MLDPEGMARRCVPGEGPPAARLVARGPAHATYRVRRDGRDFAMRLAMPAPGRMPPSPPAHRTLAAITQAAAAAGLAPPVVCSDLRTGVLVSAWAHGRPLSRADALDVASAPRIAALFRRIHALQPRGRRPRVAQAGDWVRTYRRMLAGSGMAPRPGAAALAAEADRRLAALARLPPRAVVLCHGDLHRHNLVQGPGGLTVLDWEYAHFSDPLWDLAGWLSLGDLGPAYGAKLLAAYLRRRPSGRDLSRLALLAWLYDYVCLLWIDLHGAARTGPATGGLARRARQLEKRLRGSAPLPTGRRGSG